MKGVVIVSHGSHSPKTKEEVSALAERLRILRAADIIGFAFLEIEAPSIPEGIADVIRQGATEIVVLLNFLNSGKHVDIDIPRIVDETRRKFPKVKIQISRPVGQHADIIDLFIDLIKRT